MLLHATTAPTKVLTVEPSGQVTTACHEISDKGRVSCVCPTYEEKPTTVLGIFSSATNCVRGVVAQTTRTQVE